MADDLPYHRKVFRDVKKGFQAGIAGGVLWAGVVTFDFLAGLPAPVGFAAFALGLMGPIFGCILGGCAIGAAAGLAIGSVAHSPLFGRAPHEAELSRVSPPAPVRDDVADLPGTARRHQEKLVESRSREASSGRG